MNKVYVKVDDAGRITAVNSDEFLSSLEGWIEIDGGYGDKYRLAQNNYFSNPLSDDRGLFNYKLVDGKPQQRTEAEIEADYVPPVVLPTQQERIEELEMALIELASLIGGVE